MIVPKTLEDRVHECPRCGIKLDRDHNAALNILTLGLRGSACGEAATEVDAASTLVEAYRITGSMKPSTKSKQVEAQEALPLQGKGGSHIKSR
ncbi:zinc ribbon domain-containing protein [Methanothrix sp.]|uniref:zinc ribbon domain-containing protein n=1 Tax=Methanothrix sp. TaxID=90426 RepID=UPI003983CB5B